jgi:site-specific recombinase XerD
MGVILGAFWFMKANHTQRISEVINQFILDRRASGMRPGTIRFYSQKLIHVQKFADQNNIKFLDQLEPNHIRSFLIELQDHHNQGGVHAVFRSLHALLYWYEAEYDPENWKNPIRNIRAPRVDEKILDPVLEETVEILISTCPSNTEYGRRDKAIFLFLFQTGVRASELLRMDRNDLDLNTFTALIRKSKNRHPRYVFYKRDCKRAIVTYLNQREDNSPILWLNKYGERLRYDGMRGVLQSHAEAAGIDPPNAHSFRRAFAIDRLLNDVPEHTLIHLMGQTSINALKPYLKQNLENLRKAALQKHND